MMAKGMTKPARTVPRAQEAAGLKSEEHGRGETYDPLAKIQHPNRLRLHAAELRERSYGGLWDSVFHRDIRLVKTGPCLDSRPSSSSRSEIQLAAATHSSHDDNNSPETGRGMNCNCAGVWIRLSPPRNTPPPPIWNRRQRLGHRVLFQR